MSSSTQKKFRDPVRNINREILASLEVVDTRIYPLPGGKGRRWTNEIDPRLTTLKKFGDTPHGDEITFYEHIATVRDKRSKVFYVAFRETIDAQLARERDLTLYPEWLMKTPQKQKERLIHIYMVKKHPSQVPIIRSHEDWLGDIADEPTFDALWHFLSKNNIVPE
jgi:hypothetical protein